MRILAFSHLFPNNVHDTQGLFVLERVRHMGHHADVKVVSPIPWFPLQRLFPRYARNRDVKRRQSHGNLAVLHPRFPILPGLHVLTAVSQAIALLLDAETRGLVRDAEVLDVHWTFPDGFAAAILGFCFGKPFVITLRGHEAFYEGQGRLREALIRLCLRRAAGVIAVSEELRQKAIVQAGIAPDRIKTVPNGIDAKRFHPLDRAASRNALKLKAEGKLLLSVGRLSPGKGFHLLVDALPSVLREFPDTVLLIVGEPDPEGGQAYLEKIRLSIERHGLSGHVRFLGKIAPADLVPWYSACDCFCLASASEGCPNVVLEALACGRPVVATAVGGIRDMLEDARLGIMADPAGSDFPARISQALSITWDSEYIFGKMKGQDWDWCGRNALSALLGFMSPASAGTGKTA
ncbi:MAG: glycosyl transferase, group 1 [Fibrobacteres bacterium]|nr:glycosyl transferase, group 1 [Fibrobacterota bacterium]